MVDEIFEHPRLVAIYDALDPDRSDLEVYAGIVDELGAHRVLDVGCGTGTFALLLADRGHEVTGVDPALGSLAFAKAKPGAERVQAIVDQRDWQETLVRLHRALRPGGHLVFETCDPACRAWERCHAARAGL